tara:strand:- start:974 stop:1240 length:267 start_codon:yes stop_codon:yes gene_type:complete
MLSFKSPSKNERILAMAMKKIEKMLKDMQSDGKDLSRLKLKKFQKTHHIDCKCNLCEVAEKKKDPHLRGLIEDGFKVYVGADKKSLLK